MFHLFAALSRDLAIQLVIPLGKQVGNLIENTINGRKASNLEKKSISLQKKVHYSVISACKQIQRVLDRYFT